MTMLLVSWFTSSSLAPASDINSATDSSAIILAAKIQIGHNEMRQFCWYARVFVILKIGSSWMVAMRVATCKTRSFCVNLTLTANIFWAKLCETLINLIQIAAHPSFNFSFYQSTCYIANNFHCKFVEWTEIIDTFWHLQIGPDVDGGQIRCHHKPSTKSHDMRQLSDFLPSQKRTFFCTLVPVVPHKAGAEVSTIGNHRRGQLLWRLEGRANPLTDGPKGGWNCVFWRGCSDHLTSPTTANCNCSFRRKFRCLNSVIRKIWSRNQNSRRKFRSQTSNNMDRWKAEMGRVREEKRREEKWREEKRRKEREERRSKKRKSPKKEDPRCAKR